MYVRAVSRVTLILVCTVTSVLSQEVRNQVDRSADRPP